MDSPPIYAALNVPTVTSYPSTNCLQWSADGQLCFATKTAAYIMTPDHGIHFDTSSAIKSVSEKNTHDDIPPIGWFRTIIPFEKVDVHKWPDYSQAWGAASLGSIDVSLWAIAFSPSNLSPDAGCVLAALSSNMDFTLWTSAKNCLKGEWVKVFDVTPLMIELHAPESGQENMTRQALNAQIVSIAWSPQANFGITPAPMVDGSLLVAGNRAGSLIFLRYQNNQTIKHAHTLPVADKWITHVAFSSWTLVEPGTCEAYLSYAISDGSVGVIRLTQKLVGRTDTILLPDLELSMSSSKILYEADKRGITSLSWVETRNGGLILVHSKPGILHLWSLSSGWSGYRSFLLQTQKLSAGSSAFHTSSGIQYVQRRDILILTLFDGSFHIIHNLYLDPSLTPTSTEGYVTSNNLSMAIRSVFVQSEQREIEYRDVNRITGLASYDTSSTFVWLHEASRPSDFSYKHDAKHYSMLMVAKVWDDTDDDTLILELSRVLNEAKMGFAPLSLLRPFLFRLRNQQKLATLLPRILKVLDPQIDDHSVLVAVPQWTSLSPEMRAEFRKSLARHLFGWDVLLSLRMKLSLADFSWKLSVDAEKQEECGRVAQCLLNSISYRVLRTIIRHLMASVNLLVVNDIYFIMRMVVQSMLPGSPEDLSAEGHRLSTMAHSVVSLDPHSGSVSNTFTELCPACEAEVPLQDITTAICPNGHTWARCSITTFILSTPLVRTCIGCSRKAFLPLSTPNLSTTPNWLPPAARSWIVEELLEAVLRCLFCNNSFVSVL